MPSPITIHFIDNPDYAHNNNIFSLWLTRPFTDGWLISCSWTATSSATLPSSPPC